MSKKTIVATVALIAIFVTTVPVYAQSPTPLPLANPGFFGQIEGFFSGLFHRQKETGEQNQEGTPMQGVTPENAPSGMMQPNPSGQPNYSSMQQRRLSFLVQQGKITQAQADAILAELTKVQNELKTWAD